jgi:hypothetical protein
MLAITLDETSGIALLEPDGPLSKSDFVKAAHVIDPFIERTGRLNGLIIHTESFPGWDSFAALMAHFIFVKEHHNKLSRVAVATDSVIGFFAEAIARPFVNAQIKLFPYLELEQARQWAASDPKH